jgi:membrane-associated progesterone receptor component
VYPFAGKEVARAFALISTEVKDCNDDLSDLGHMEMENLKEWEGKFNWKYPVVGRIIGK